jgi:tetratricopeptide (TPR) repeat protein
VKTRIRSFILGSVSLLFACGYYNTMYNANQLFSDAEKAYARGDLQAARTAYQQSIEKAQANLERHPTSRWSDDARLLLARAHLQLGDAGAARVAFLQLLENNPDPRRKAAAQIYLGLLAAQIGDDSDALIALDAGLQDRNAEGDLIAMARLARAGIHYRAGRFDAAAADLRTVVDDAPAHIRAQAGLLDLRLALASSDSTRARSIWHALLRNAQSQRFLDSLNVLAVATASVFSARETDSMLSAIGSAPWPAAARDSLLLMQAELALQKGDTSLAITSAQRIVARSSGPFADQVRVRIARWKLAQVSGTEQLTGVRAELLPALSNDRARTLIQSINTVEVLLEHARATGQPLAMFAAGELARDDLAAPSLATELFLAYADIAPQSIWAPKAVLAALALQPAAESRLKPKLESYHDNPYWAVTRGEPADAEFTAAEEKLTAALQPLLLDAMRAAQLRDNSVVRAVAVIDSIRVVALADSTRAVCGVMLDSLGARGIRADSMRVACLRGDRARVGALIKIDTLLLRDTAKARLDSLNRPVRRDTFATR